MPDRYVARVVPAGAAGLDAFVAAIFVWALMGFGNVYYGLARYVMDRTIETVKKKSSIGLSRPMSYHPEVQHAISDMVIELETAEALLDRAAQDWADNTDPAKVGQLLIRVLAAKFRAVESSWR